MTHIQDAYVEYINKIAEELKQDNDVMAIAVFGSVVKTNRKPNDIDMLIVFRDRVKQEILDNIKDKYRDPPLHIFARVVNDLNRFTTLWLEIYFRGVVLYDKDGILMSKLEAWKRKIEKLLGKELSEYPTILRFPFSIDLEQLTLE
jgi:predicted nucleotidyltransferase